MFDDAMDRRAFVKGCIKAGIAGLGIGAGLGLTASYSVRDTLDDVTGSDRQSVSYIGAKVIREGSGQAPRGIPILPVTVQDGEIQGSPRLEGESVLDWYKYCGHKESPPLQSDFEPETEALVYRDGERPNPWYGDMIGEPARVEHFGDPPQGAAVSWRSQNQKKEDRIPVILLRLDPGSVTYEGVSEDRVRAAGLDHGFLAFAAYCTYFCCTLGWKHAEEQAKAHNAWDKIYCRCHHDKFDPFTIAPDEYVLKDN